MIPLTKSLPLVQSYGEAFRSVLTEEEFKQFLRYLSGLITGVNKTVEGINRLFFLDLQDQSTLNRFLSASAFDVQALNRVRLEWLQQCASIRFQNQPGFKGVLVLDDTLLTHYGKHFEKAAVLYDHVNKNYTWAHCLVNFHYSDDRTDYPVDFRLWEPADLDQIERALTDIGCSLSPHQLRNKEQDPKAWRTYLLRKYNKKRIKPPEGKTLEVVYKTKVDYALEMIDAFFAQYPEVDLPVAFDNWYTCAALCKHLDKVHQKAYVGTLDDQDKILFGPEGTERCCKDFAQDLVQRHKQALANKEEPLFKKVGIHYKGKKETYYAYCDTHKIKNLGRQRLVISFRKEDLSEAQAKYYISNRLHWRSGGILRIRRHRWPIEVYHEEGKAEGLDQYQLRKFDAVKKHIACVCVAYSMLKRVQFDPDFLHKQRWRPDTSSESLAFWRRVMVANSLLELIVWTLGGASLSPQLIQKITAAFL